MFVELPSVDTELKEGGADPFALSDSFQLHRSLRRLVRSDQMGSVESVKAASDIFAPVSGIVKEVNEKLADQSNLLNRSPEADGTPYNLLSIFFESDAASQVGLRRSSSRIRPRWTAFSRRISTPLIVKAKISRLQGCQQHPYLLSIVSPVMRTAIDVQYPFNTGLSPLLPSRTWFRISS